MDKIKRILVTGNMGYIGPVLTSYLRENHSGIEIHGLDLGFFGQCPHWRTSYTGVSR